MSKRRLPWYTVDTKSEAAAKSAGFMGIAMFLRIVYFFAMTRLEDTDQFMLIFGLVLPVAVEITYLILMKGLRQNNLWLYAITGAVQMVILIVLCFQYQNTLRLVLGILVYLLCGAGLIVMALGLIKNKLVLWSILAVAVGKVLFYNLVQNILGLRIIPLVFEMAAVMELLALCALAASVKKRK